MKNLLYKELRLVAHPATILFLALSAMLLIPNYPYYVIFFYTGLGIFFCCLSGRENHDIFYTMSMPVRKLDLVRGRFLFVFLLELTQILAAIPFAAIRQKLPMPGNLVGMDANIAFFGLSLGMLGVFNLVFFGKYYRRPDKVGMAFCMASIAVAAYMILAEVCAHAVPFVRDRLDTPDTMFLAEKCWTLLAGAAVYAGLTLVACRRAVRVFETLDL